MAWIFELSMYESLMRAIGYGVQFNLGRGQSKIKIPNHNRSLKSALYLNGA